MSLWSTENVGGVVIATYTNPPMNYFCAQGAQELSALIDRWASPDIRAVVLTGVPKGPFITHYSVEELLSYAEDRDSFKQAGTALNDGYHGLLLRLRDLPKPVIAAMNGDAMGGGFELCLACDIRVAGSGDHRFGLPEVKLGIIPGGSGTQRLARLIGAGRAIEFVLRGRVVTPEMALGLGLVHELAADALTRAREIAAEMSTLSAHAVGMVKRAVYDGIDTNLAAGLKIEAQSFVSTMLSDDAVQAMRYYVSLPTSKRRAWLESSASMPPLAK